MSTQYRTCDFCNAHLDPGERCDCRPDYSELFGLDSVGATSHPDINVGRPVPLLKMGKITDPELNAWFNRNSISVGELQRRKSAQGVTSTPDGETSPKADQKTP